jgi:hypothetical protein
VVDIAGRLTALLEHVPKKLLDFFDKGMLNLFEFERFLFDHVIPLSGISTMSSTCRLKLS